MKYTKKDVKILKENGIIPNGTPDHTVDHFLKVCEERNLSPFTNQVYIVERNYKNGDKWEKRYTIQTAVDGLRAIASRTGTCAGISDPTYNQSQDSKYPESATVTVKKIVQGVVADFTATARWSEFCVTYKGGNLSPMWGKMPFHMLGKVAESLALRKAFPEELGAIFSEVESSPEELVSDIEDNSNSLQVALTNISEIKDLDSLKNFWDNNKGLQNVSAFRQAVNEAKIKLSE